MSGWKKLGVQGKILVPVCSGLFLVIAIQMVAGIGMLKNEKDSGAVLRNDFIANLYGIAVSDRQAEMEKAANILIDTDEVITFLEGSGVENSTRMVLDGVILSIGENMGIRRYSLYNMDLVCVSQHAEVDVPRIPDALDSAHREPFRKCADAFDYQTFFRTVDNNGRTELEICMVTVVTDDDDEVLGFVEVASRPQTFAENIRIRTGSPNAFLSDTGEGFACATEPEFFAEIAGGLGDDAKNTSVSTGQAGEMHYLADKVPVAMADGSHLGNLWVINDETAKTEAQKQALWVSGVTVSLATLGILATLILLLRKSVVVPMSQVMARVSNASSLVSSASGQIAGNSIQLADRSTDQAASIQTSSASLKELSRGTTENTGNAKRADSLMIATLDKVTRGRQASNDMIATMDAIKASSDETSKIIKTINEIAFQTNLLALNAAVEAARAGDSGRGFAVVAEEVRNLAQRSQEAANSTAQMIDEARNRANEGVSIVGKVSDDFTAIQDDTQSCGALVAEIASATEQQSCVIDEVNDALEKIDVVVQQSAANAEESASTGEELSGQATELNGLVVEMTSIIKGA